MRKKTLLLLSIFEYTAYNYQAFDIANHFAEFAGIDNPDYSLYPEGELQKAWLSIYLQEYNNVNYVPENDINLLYTQVNKFVLFVTLFFGVVGDLYRVSIRQSTLIFLEYAAIRFNEYFKWKEECLRTRV